MIPKYMNSLLSLVSRRNGLEASHMQANPESMKQWLLSSLHSRIIGHYQNFISQCTQIQIWQMTYKIKAHYIYFIPRNFHCNWTLFYSRRNRQQSGKRSSFCYCTSWKKWRCDRYQSRKIKKQPLQHWSGCFLF